MPFIHTYICSEQIGYLFIYLFLQLKKEELRCDPKLVKGVKCHIFVP